MRMPLLTTTMLTLFVAMPAGAQQPMARSKATSERCIPANDLVGDRARQGPRSGKLGDQPPAARLYALYNVVDGCPQPIVLTEGIGANPERKLPMTRAPARPRALR